MSSSARLAGRVALVTGASRGLGHAIAAALADSGAAVALTARNPEEIDRVAQGLEAAGAVAAAWACDVREAAAVEALVVATVRRFGGIDILVNNAGVFRMSPVASTTDGDWDAILDTNLKGAFLVTRAALPHLVARRGHVFNIVSSAGRAAFRDNGAYCASKWGLLGFTNVLREELRETGVRVTALLPGPIDTPIWEGVPGTWDRARMLRAETVAGLLVEVCTQPPGTSTDEVAISPTGGAL